MPEREAREKILESAWLLNGRAAYASKLNVVLQTLFDENLDRLRAWGEDQVRSFRGEFVNELNRLLIRTLILELCVIFDPLSRRNEKYCLAAILQSIRHHNNIYPANLFSNLGEIREVSVADFVTLPRDQALPIFQNDGDAVQWLENEFNAFIARHDNELLQLRRARDQYLAHPDVTSNLPEIAAAFLIDGSEWANVFSNLLLQSLAAAGARLYVEGTRQQIRAFVRNDYNSLLQDIID